MGRTARVRDQMILGPVALKYRDLRWVRVRIEHGAYLCPRHDGLLTSKQVEFPAPHLTYEQLLSCPRRMVRVR
jgi:hypothetical protein